MAHTLVSQHPLSLPCIIYISQWVKSRSKVFTGWSLGIKSYRLIACLRSYCRKTHSNQLQHTAAACWSDHVSHSEHLLLAVITALCSWKPTDSHRPHSWPNHQRGIYTHTDTYRLTQQRACQQLTRFFMYCLANFVILFSCPSQFHTSFPGVVG